MSFLNNRTWARVASRWRVCPVLSKRSKSTTNPSSLIPAISASSSTSSTHSPPPPQPSLSSSMFWAISGSAAVVAVSSTTTSTSLCDDDKNTVINNDTSAPTSSLEEGQTPRNDDASSSTNELDDNSKIDDNPFWPSGVDSAQVDALVEECLNDPSINLRAIPDVLERQIYASTIQLTLNLIYHALGQLHGTSILAHELRLSRVETDPDRKKDEHKNQEWQLSQVRGGVDEETLEAVADRMLANTAVNQTLIPDVVERQVYVNCLKIVFRLLDLLSASLAVTVCGHEFRLAMEPAQRRALLLQEAKQVLSDAESTKKTKRKICTPVDTELLLKYAAHEAGIDMHKTMRAESGWSRWFNFRASISDEFVVQLHASLYSLILGILDDLLEQTQLTLLSDTVQLDLVAVPEHVRQLRKQQQMQAQHPQGGPRDDDDSKPKDVPDTGGAGYLPFASFTMGVGVGLTLMALVHGKSFK